MIAIKSSLRSRNALGTRLWAALSLVEEGERRAAAVDHVVGHMALRGWALAWVLVMFCQQAASCAQNSLHSEEPLRTRSCHSTTDCGSPELSESAGFGKKSTAELPSRDLRTEKFLKV